jgi:hypothetical protein
MTDGKLDNAILHASGRVNDMAQRASVTKWKVPFQLPSSDLWTGSLVGLQRHCYAAAGECGPSADSCIAQSDNVTEVDMRDANGSITP